MLNMSSAAIAVEPLPVNNPPQPARAGGPSEPQRREPTTPFGWQKVSGETDGAGVFSMVHARQIKGGVLVRTSSRWMRNGQIHALSESTAFVPGELDKLDLKPKAPDQSEPKTSKR